MRQSKRLIALLAIIALILLGVALFLFFHFYQKSQIDNKINEAKDLITAGNYPEALIITNDLLNSNIDAQELYQIRADLGQLMLDYDLARDSYNHLFDLTQNPVYQQKSDFVGYGNLPNNTLSGGQVIQAGSAEFFITFDSNPNTESNPVYSYNLWRIQNGQKESLFLDEGPGAYIGDLQTWGNNLYFRTSQGIKVFNLYNQTVSDLVIEGTETNTPTDYTETKQLTIYNGEIYFVSTVIQGTYYVYNSVNKCSLDGHNITEVVPKLEDTSQGITTINSFFPLNDRVYFKSTNNTDLAIQVDMGGIITQLLETENMAENFTANSAALFVAGQTYVSPAPQIYKISFLDNSVVPISLASPVNNVFGVGADNSDIFYFGPGGLSQVNMNLTETKELGQNLNPETQKASIYILGNNIYVYQVGTFDGTNKTIINSINRNNPTENSILFTGNQ